MTKENTEKPEKPAAKSVELQYPKESIPLPDNDTEPPSADEVIQEEVVKALMAGDAVTAAKALRKLDALHKPVPELLADLFDGNPELGAWFPYRLKLVPRKPGKPPVDYLTKQAKEQVIARALILAKANFGKLEAAIAHVQHQYELLKGKKLSRATILKCYKAHKDKLSS